MFIARYFIVGFKQFSSTFKVFVGFGFSNKTGRTSTESSVSQEVSDIMLKPGLFILLISQVLLNKTCKDGKKKCDPLEKLRKILKLPEKSHSIFRSDHNVHHGQIDNITVLHSETSR